MLSCFGYDSAASNLRAVAFLASLVDKRPPDNLIMLPEPCLSHQVHIIKAGSFDLTGLSGVLYSSTKLLRLSSSLNGLRTALRNIIDNSLDVRHEVGPDNIDQHDLVPFAWKAFCVDGGRSFMVKRNARGVGEPTPFSEICGSCALGLVSIGVLVGGCSSLGLTRVRSRLIELVALWVKLIEQAL